VVLIRIPGPQPTAGLEGLYLREDSGWIPKQGGSLEVHQAAVHAVLPLWAGPGLQLTRDTLATGPQTETGLADADHGAALLGSETAWDVSETGQLQADTISGHFHGVDSTLSQAAAQIGAQGTALDPGTATGGGDIGPPDTRDPNFGPVGVTVA